MQNKYKDKGVVMMALSSEPNARVAPMVQGSKMNYVVGAEAQATQYRYRVNKFPTIFVFDREGKLAYNGHYAPEAEQVIDRLLKS